MAVAVQVRLAAVTDRAADFEGDARKVLADALNEVSSVEPDVVIRSSVAEGHPAEVLVRAARGADMLVVGAGDTADSPGRCSARSASTACVVPLSRPGHPGDRLERTMTAGIR